jgi:hypothetical protein
MTPWSSKIVDEKSVGEISQNSTHFKAVFSSIFTKELMIFA